MFSVFLKNQSPVTMLNIAFACSLFPLSRWRRLRAHIVRLSRRRLLQCDTEHRGLIFAFTVTDQYISAALRWSLFGDRLHLTRQVRQNIIFFALNFSI